MAAEVPVNDVLCEAMEYLCKLGSNLRMRSEKLKEKRICKDKLRNAHAVHKAAKKVLLICELSKKSLENVETGVRKVLSIVDASQAPSVGGKTIDKKQYDESKQKFYYFEHESHKLRISKKISLKHFMSVRVIAKGMTASMQEKYPVFYDCKLKQRRRITSEKGKLHNKSETSPRNSICHSDKTQNNEQSRENRKKLDKVSESDTSKAERSIMDEKYRKKSVDHNKIKADRTKSQVKTPISDDEEVTSKTNDRGTTSGTQDDNFQCKPDYNKQSSVNLIDAKNDQEPEIVKPKKVLSESGRETDEEKLEKNSNGKNIEECQNKTSMNLTNLKMNLEKEKSFTRRKLNKIRVIDSSESDEESLKNKCGKRKQEGTHSSLGESNNTSGSEPKSKKIKLSDMDDGSKNKENSDHDTTESKNNETELDDNSKPIIRCVNITKLLKPDVLDTKIDELLDDEQTKRNKQRCSTKCNTEQSKLSEDDRARKQKDKIAMQIKNDKEFWEQKRMEVKQFKPKQFDVNVERLPCLSINFLIKHNIKKIIQGSNTICELTKKKEKVLEHSIKKNDEVKSALLNDSESDDVDSALAAEANKVKNSLLCDSDSDKNLTTEIVENSNGRNVAAVAKRVKKSLLNDSDSDKELDSEMVENSHQRSTEAEAKRVKKSLLNDSDSDKELNSELVENSNQCSMQAEAKRVKNSLLNDSDSDIEPNSEMVEDNNQCSTEAKAKSVKNYLHNDSDSDKELNSEMVENSNQCSMEAEAKRVKNSLLNDSDSDKELNSEMFQNSNQCSKKAEAKIVKNSLLNDSDSDKEQNLESFENNNQSDEENITDSAAIKDALLHDSDSENNEKQVEEKNKHIKSGIIDSQKDLAQEVAEKIKSALLNDSDSDKSQDQDIEDNNEKMVTPQEIINDKEGGEPIGSDKEANDVSEHNEEDNVYKALSDVQKEDTTHEKIKSSLLNDSSDSKSETSVFKRKRRKLKHKRKHVIKSMQAKKMLLHYSSSSDEKEHSQASEEDSKKQNYKKGRKISGASSSSEEITKKHKKEDSRHSATPKKNTAKDCGHSDNEDKDSRSIDQVDGTIDEHSDSSVSKMVRSKSKPSGSSGQNSDNQDASDKDIDGLTNLNNLNKSHRRRDSSTNNTQSRSSTRKTSRSKPPPLIGEDLLQAVSSSDASDDDHGEEDLPPVKLAGLNGDSIGHLAKDDLLGDSDSSASQDKDQSEEAPIIDDSEEEENVKLKRRKAANAISSDSDGGAARRKQRDDDVRLSDFDESDDSTESSKRAKRKKIASESDGSGGSSNDGGKKKRRRIKQLNDSDASGSDTENEGRNKHGRKNIRKVMGKNQLEEATKKAAREEKERIARITERQKLYNNLEFDESGKPDEVVLEKVVLDFDPETKEPLIEVDRGLVKKLKPHQANGIKFMWDACFESVKRIKKDRGSGCILAHCMGLGKTLQVISLTHTLLIHGSLTGVNRVLVVCPLSTVLNWVNEFRMWLKHAHSEFEVDIYELSRYKQNSERAFQLQQWFEGGGVCVLGYEMFRNLSADNNKKFKKKMLRSFQESLVEPGPDLVVCDEGHLLKNEKTSLSQSMNRVRTRRRIVLTGTPLQNNLKEYYCMVQFVKPNLLGKYNEYLNRFVNPITNGQYTDSTEYDIKVMKRRSHVLHKMLDGAVQRRDYGVLAPFLPPKHEYVLFITLSDVQVKLYQFYLDNYSRRPLPGKSSGFLFPDFQSLQRIWTHPLVLKYNSERYEIMQQKKREREEEDSEGSLVDFIDDDSTPDESSTEESSDDLSDVSDDSRKKSKKKKSAKKSKGKESKAGSRRGTRANPIEADEDVPEVSEVVEVRNENPTEWWIKLVEDEELDDMRNSHKLVLLFDILRQCDTIGDKLLVFSQSLYSLDLIEHFLGKVDEATQEGRIDDKLGRHVGSWSPGVDYFRLDGSTSCENRSIWCKNFNREDNPRARLFLISTRAGGLGINLVAANRVVIFDVSWNPSHDVQSIFRVYRFGQKKPCYVYRFLAMGTMEEKIYERQVTKQAISKRVIDEQQIDRHYAENDLAELYKFEARPDEPRPLPTLPKDRLFAEMLREHEAQIYKYHEHDSLLENKEEETLSEEERKAAWEDFENEKNKPPPAPFPTAWPGMVPGLLAQQQQQLAYAALASMLRKDMPNINDNQIRDMLPLIYNSNPGLMQKMGEIYKYAQPQMMNPGMMNPIMNPASAGAAAGGMGGTSGLQYEPPWQRQHQQQQQMRLQQLMQQNQQMGAKLYAGGLGSRDPVAMALQQQRAREIMMGGGANRPRGRPPLAPRLAAPAQDVVNLDSD